MLDFLIDNIFVMFDGRLFQWTVRIPMGISCDPHYSRCYKTIYALWYHCIYGLFIVIYSIRDTPYICTMITLHLWIPCWIHYEYGVSSYPGIRTQ